MDSACWHCSGRGAHKVAVVAVIGAKGGVGSSLVALHARGSAMLIDLNLISPSADLLLDLAIERSWADLAPVADELTQRHLELAAATSSHGLMFLAAPAHLPTNRSARMHSPPVAVSGRAFHMGRSRSRATDGPVGRALPGGDGYAPIDNDSGPPSASRRASPLRILACPPVGPNRACD